MSFIIIFGTLSFAIGRVSCITVLGGLHIDATRQIRWIDSYGGYDAVLFYHQCSNLLFMHAHFR